MKFKLGDIVAYKSACGYNIVLRVIVIRDDDSVACTPIKEYDYWYGGGSYWFHEDEVKLLYGGYVIKLNQSGNNHED